MFKFLKEKLKNALNKFSKDVDQESNVVEETVKETVKELEQHADDVDVQDVPTNSVEGINAIDNNSKKQKKSGKSVFNEDEFGMHPDEFKRLQKEKEPEIEIKEPELFLKEKRKKKKSEPVQEEIKVQPSELLEEPELDMPPEPDVNEKEVIELKKDTELFEEFSPEEELEIEKEVDEDIPDIDSDAEQEVKKYDSSKEEKIEPFKDETEDLDDEVPITDQESEEKEEDISEKEEEIANTVEVLEQEGKPAEPEKKGFFARLKEKIIGKEKIPEEEGYVEEIPQSKEDKNIEEMAKGMDEPPALKVLSEPPKQVKEKTVQPKFQKEKDEDDKALEEEGYKEVSAEPVNREVRIPEYVDKEEKLGFFSKIASVVTKTIISEDKFDELFWELEMPLLENNVAVEVIDKIKRDLKSALVNRKIPRGKSLDVIKETLARSLNDLFEVPEINLINEIKNKKNKEKKPYVVSFIGINGSGKTTTIAKVAHMLKTNGVSCVVAAADTFRAAAIQQLEEHAHNVGVKIIKQDYGADPAAVAYDAVKYAEAKNIDCVLIDTAGRLHSNTNLMDEMKKIMRVADPDLKIFIGEAITGNDCVEQAKEFNKAVGIDGIILCKADVDEKGGAAISVSYVTGKPILYLGNGQSYGDLLKFDKSIVLDTVEV